jgi:hypothetical protein
MTGRPAQRRGPAIRVVEEERLLLARDEVHARQMRRQDRRRLIARPRDAPSTAPKICGWRTPMANASSALADTPNTEAFFRDVLEYSFVDAGHDWLIFALPPAELALHPAESAGGRELFLLSDDVQAFVQQMAERGVPCSELKDRGRDVVIDVDGERYEAAPTAEAPGHRRHSRVNEPSRLQESVIRHRRTLCG